ncbi:MAG: ribonuclease [Clostridiales bacterium]|nr:ribonuclease [Clostridiales bacterium]
MNRLKKTFLPVILIVALLFTGCEIVLEGDETESESVRHTTVTEVETETESTPVTETEEEETEPSETPSEPSETAVPTESQAIDRDGSYTTAEDVALYIYTYGELPSNFMTKNEARDLGWEGGSLEPYAPGMCIGGDWYGNYEGMLPETNGREYHECDINTLGASSRGAERIVFSNDGLIYYTPDHYETFTLMYGQE